MGYIFIRYRIQVSFTGSLVRKKTEFSDLNFVHFTCISVTDPMTECTLSSTLK